jgi:hypothetical protein
VRPYKAYPSKRKRLYRKRGPSVIHEYRAVPRFFLKRIVRGMGRGAGGRGREGRGMGRMGREGRGMGREDRGMERNGGEAVDGGAGHFGGEGAKTRERDLG